MLVPIGQIVFIHLKVVVVKMSKLTFIISDYFFPTTLIIYLLSGLVLIQVACLLCSFLVITTSAPLEKEIRTTEEENYEGIPPIMTATRQLIESELPEKEERSFPEVDELAESEYPVAAKEDREFREVNAEEFFRRLERELATKMAWREGINEKGNKEDRDFELKGNDEKREEIELLAEMFQDEHDEVSRNSPKDEDLTTADRSLKRELEEMLAREIAEETKKRELGEEEEEEEEKELMLRPERMFSREVPEKSERILDREIKTALKEEDRHNKHRGEPAEEGRKTEPEEKREKHEENMASNQKREEEKEEEEEEERAARSRELNFRTMHSGEITPEWKKLDERVRASEERKWREREAERERERFDYHGNKEREREELRERRREEALENGKLVHEREMEGRKQRETLGSHGARLEERERFRFRARGN